jgi:hypothetical protein
MMYNCRDILLFNKYSAMVGDNEKLMLCYLLSFSSVLPKLLLDKSPYKNVNKITRQIISVQNMGPNFCDLCGSLPLTLCFGKVRIIRSKQADRAFGSFTDRLSVGLLYYYILFIIVVYVLLRI